MASANQRNVSADSGMSPSRQSVIGLPASRESSRARSSVCRSISLANRVSTRRRWAGWARDHSPALEHLARGGHGPVDVLGPAGGDRGDHLAGRGVVHLHGRAAGRGHERAVDVGVGVHRQGSGVGCERAVGGGRGQGCVGLAQRDRQPGGDLVGLRGVECRQGRAWGSDVHPAQLEGVADLRRVVRALGAAQHRHHLLLPRPRGGGVAGQRGLEQGDMLGGQGVGHPADPRVDAQLEVAHRDRVRAAHDRQVGAVAAAQATYAGQVA